MKSMTGFGSFLLNNEKITVSVEVKSVNQRFLECQIRLPKPIPALEEKVKLKVKEFINRGKIELSIVVEGEIHTARNLKLDENLIEQFIEASRSLQGKYKELRPLDVNELLMNKELATIVEAEDDFCTIEETMILQAVEQALQSLVTMRQKEGEHLFKDMQIWLTEIKSCCDRIEHILPIVIQKYEERLQKRIDSFLNGEWTVEEGRVLTEVAIFADKIDISEEIVRLKTHLEQYIHYCNQDEPIGRRLDFLIQEMNREVNTIGAKASDTTVRQQVVEMKGFIEKLKEQAQNIE
ncbi:YicC/YloC family endoribonuclease [Bacillus suaedae]|uniref:YicC family protein n=1 Tax=Halalkalibacter suaedae TaxID=2822140 RepID=A0A941APS3_9BACI|nr:YicC/YloC family endoribonuclease [Bacillus suaedae]MBP3952091.1 YicC family protein [Bacillus suaedae]